MSRTIDTDRDRGTVLVLVLVLMLIGSLVVLPTMTYAITVMRTAQVPADKAAAVALAKGGVWVALENESDLYDLCDGGPIPSSLAGVSVSCGVLDTETLRPAAEVPYRVAVVRADETIPTQVSEPSDDYPNPNTTSTPGDWDAWLDTPDWTASSTAGKVWLPELPVRATSAGGLRDTTMLPGTQDPLYASCRVFFPGTFDTPITIDGPAYFTSGVYYFTDQLTIANGADVVVGNGEAGGCTTDFEAVASATVVPDPLNMSGLGGTFVFGESGRLVIDDTVGSGDIRFAVNQRYVSTDETSVAASSDVSIVSVNGTHEPFLPGEALGDDLAVDGVIAVPASTVGVDGSPAATDSDYLPSVLTPKPTEPDAPTNVQITAGQDPAGGSDRGRLTVTWDVPNDNGALITGYTATESLFGNTCTTTPPTATGLPAQASCTIEGLTHRNSSQDWYTVTVVATNDLGDSPASVPSSDVRIDLSGASQSPHLDPPTSPIDAEIGTDYADGLEVTWTASADDGGTPITGYRVEATDTLTSAVVTCDAWWDETACVLTAADGLTAGVPYDVTVTAITSHAESTPAEVDGDELDTTLPEPDPATWSPGPSPAPIRVPAIPTARVPDPIVELVTETNTRVEIDVAGMIATPQGRVEIGAAVPGRTDVSLTGGIVASSLWVDPGGTPAFLDVSFDNPVAQKRIRILSDADVSGFDARSQAVVRINRSGSLRIASWHTQ